MKLESLISEAADSVSEPILLFGLERGSTPSVVQAWGNVAFLRMLGWSEIALADDVFSQFLDEVQSKRVLDELASQAEDQRELTFKVRIQCDQGARVPHEMVAKPLRRRDAAIAYFCVSFRIASVDEDLFSDLADARAEAALSSQRLWDAIEALPDAFVMYDERDALVVCNQKYKDFYQTSAPAIFPGAKFEDIMRYGVENGQYPEAKGKEEAWLADVLERFRGSDEPINRVLSDGRHIVIHDMHTGHGDVVGLRTDVTLIREQESLLRAQTRELEKAKLDAEAASTTDPLTGLGNRRGLERFFAEVGTAFNPKLSLAALHFDLDKFKEINDLYGHRVGGLVLLRLAKSVQKGIGRDGYAARIGGDEFLAIVWAEDIQKHSEQLAELVINECADAATYDNVTLSFGVSIGIACTDTPSLLELWANSDVALYESKRTGRGNYTLYSPELAAMAVEKRELYDALTLAIANDAIEPFFQPQVSAESESVIGIEALARWNHHSLGSVPTERFLPAAEELGLLPDLDMTILRKSMVCVETLQGLGLEMPTISINVGERTLISEKFHRAVAEAKFRSCNLILELLETIDFEIDGEAYGWAVEVLRQLGAQIALDDFGSGRSSLTSLMDLRPDRIKIDRRISAAIGGKRVSDIHMMKAICEMGKAIGVGVTAEGIERRLQADTAKELGCDALQGYLFAAPISQSELVRFLSGGHIQSTSMNAANVLRAS